MAVTLPIEVYEAFEKGMGKEEAKVVVKSLESTIDDITAHKWDQTKNELLERLASKEDLKELKENFKVFSDKTDNRFIQINDQFNGLKDSFNNQLNGLRDSFDSRLNETNKRIDETNKRIDAVMKIQLWIMGLIAIQAVAVIVKIIFLS